MCNFISKHKMFSKLLYKYLMHNIYIYIIMVIMVIFVRYKKLFYYTYKQYKHTFLVLLYELYIHAVSKRKASVGFCIWKACIHMAYAHGIPNFLSLVQDGKLRWWWPRGYLTPPDLCWIRSKILQGSKMYTRDLNCCIHARLLIRLLNIVVFCTAIL